MPPFARSGAAGHLAIGFCLLVTTPATILRHRLSTRHPGGAVVGGKTVRYALVAGALIALSPALALAQAADDLSGLRKDIDALKEGQAALLRELQQIKSLLSASPPAPRAGPAPEAVLTVRGGTSKGSKDAKVTLVEFTDYQ